MPKADQFVRLPRTRESRPALLALALVLIVGGALASAYLAFQAGNRSYFVQVTHEVTQGGRISADDLGRISLPEDFEGGIPSDQADRVVGKAATTRLLPGTVLIDSMVADEAGVRDNQTQLSMSVDANAFIKNLHPGAQLALNVGSNDSEADPAAILAELVSVGGAEKGGLTSSGQDTVSIVVSVDVSCLGTVSRGIQDNSITPALVGGDGNGIVQATCGG